MRLSAAIGLAFTLWASGLEAHEFWVEPVTFQVDLGDEIAVDLRVGQMLAGRSYPYLSHKFARYEVTDSAGVHALLGNEGDLPSAAYAAAAPGLNIISYDALPERLTYDAFRDFVDFVEEEGLPTIAARHRERGLPDTGFVEAYTRNAKALVQVGPVKEGQNDTVTGMPFELVALENPYAGGATLPVRLLWQGNEVPGAQIALFRRSGTGAVIRTTYRTDETGMASIPLTGNGTYLLSAVHLEESPAESGAVWNSTWASLTFGLTGRGRP